MDEHVLILPTRDEVVLERIAQIRGKNEAEKQEQQEEERRSEIKRSFRFYFLEYARREFGLEERDILDFKEKEFEDFLKLMEKKAEWDAKYEKKKNWFFVCSSIGTIIMSSYFVGRVGFLLSTLAAFTLLLSYPFFDKGIANEYIDAQKELKRVVPRETVSPQNISTLLRSLTKL